MGSRVESQKSKEFFDGFEKAFENLGFPYVRRSATRIDFSPIAQVVCSDHKQENSVIRRRQINRSALERV